MATELSWKSRLRRIAGEGILRTPLLSYWKSRSAPAWKVLTYHRVVSPESVPYPLQPGMYVTPESFRMQLEFLARSGPVISLEQLLLRIAAGTKVDPGTVVITIDDGWKDNFEHAFPIIRSTGLPVTICLATSFIGTDRWFWTDRIVQLLDLMRRQAELRRAFLDRLKTFSDYSPQLTAVLRDAASGTGALQVALADSVVEQLKAAPLSARQAIIREILALGEGAVAPERQFLDWDEVRRMEAAGVHFISHSHRHENMAELGDEQLRGEVMDSQRELEAHGLPAPPVLCYPGGRYGDRAQRVLSEQGIRFALVTSRESDFSQAPALIGRVGIHEDVSATKGLFAARLWAPGF